MHVEERRCLGPTPWACFFAMSISGGVQWFQFFFLGASLSHPGGWLLKDRMPELWKLWRKLLKKMEKLYLLFLRWILNTIYVYLSFLGRLLIYSWFSSTSASLDAFESFSGEFEQIDGWWIVCTTHFALHHSPSFCSCPYLLKWKDRTDHMISCPGFNWEIESRMQAARKMHVPWIIGHFIGTVYVTSS